MALRESDVDVFVELDPAKRVGMFELVEIARFLEESLGRPVDIATRRSLRPGRHYLR
jgi:hypothetical protein